MVSTWWAAWRGWAATPAAVPHGRHGRHGRLGRHGHGRGGPWTSSFRCFGEFFGCLPRVILAVCPTPTCAWTWDLHPTSLCAADGGRSTTQNNANPPRGQTNPAINACKSYVRVRPWQ